jgi:hypothetical protein
MTAKRTPLELRLELLRVRAAADRLDLALAVQDLAAQSAALRRRVGSVRSFVRALGERADAVGLGGVARTLLRHRGWLVPAALGALGLWRSSRGSWWRRLRLIAVGAIAAGTGAWIARRRNARSRSEEAKGGAAAPD